MVSSLSFQAIGIDRHHQNQYLLAFFQCHFYYVFYCCSIFVCGYAFEFGDDFGFDSHEFSWGQGLKIGVLACGIEVVFSRIGAVAVRKADLILRKDYRND